jgi:uncharacterized protein
MIQIYQNSTLSSTSDNYLPPGLSAVTLLLSNGDIMGCSGIIGSTMLDPISTISNVSNRWKFIFLGSFVAAVNMTTASASRDHLMIMSSSASPLAYAMGGFCVGIGTRLSNGCTSGHGVCGLGRFSQRSLAAVLMFLTSGICTATFVVSPNTPWATSTTFLRHQGGDNVTSSVLRSAILVMSTGLAALCFSRNDKATSQKEQSFIVAQQRKSYGAMISGALFAVGLGISGMAQTSKANPYGTQYYAKTKTILQISIFFGPYERAKEKPKLRNRLYSGTFCKTGGQFCKPNPNVLNCCLPGFSPKLYH